MNMHSKYDDMHRNAMNCTWKCTDNHIIISIELHVINNPHRLLSGMEITYFLWPKPILKANCSKNWLPSTPLCVEIPLSCLCCVKIYYFPHKVFGGNLCPRYLQNLIGFLLKISKVFLLSTPKIIKNIIYTFLKLKKIYNFLLFYLCLLYSLVNFRFKYLQSPWLIFPYQPFEKFLPYCCKEKFWTLSNRLLRFQIHYLSFFFHWRHHHMLPFTKANVHVANELYLLTLMFLRPSINLSLA